MEFFFSYFVIINILAALVMFIDKRRAIDGAWRISEKQIFLVAIFGGALGVLVGMQLFRHKTKRRSFRYGIPAILCFQFVLITYHYLY